MKSLLVTSQVNQSVREYNGTTGAFVKVAASGGALGDPLGLVIGLDGNLLVSDGQTNQVKRYDSATGAFIDVFASTNLAGPMGMTIHQGVLYVTNSNPPQGVQRFDAATGANTGNFVPSLANPHARDVKVNPANNRLYVLYYNAATVETFDLTTMASFGLLMPAGNPIGSGGLYTPSAMAFGPDGNLYISGGTFGGNLGVRRYNATTGAFIDFFANTGSDLYVPIGITFGPDNNLYVATQNAANVMRFNYPTGTFMDFFIPDGGGGLTAPFHLTFGAGPFAERVTSQYAAKFVCGKSAGKVVAPGVYFTAVNVHNPTCATIHFRVKIAVALPGLKPGAVSKFHDARLGPDEAMEIDCRDIFKFYEAKADFLKGFVVIESEVELDVVAVYTAAGRDGQVETLHTERVPARHQKAEAREVCVDTVGAQYGAPPSKGRRGAAEGGGKETKSHKKGGRRRNEVA